MAVIKTAQREDAEATRECKALRDRANALMSQGKDGSFTPELQFEVLLWFENASKLMASGKLTAHQVVELTTSMQIMGRNFPNR